MKKTIFSAIFLTLFFIPTILVMATTTDPQPVNTACKGGALCLTNPLKVNTTLELMGLVLNSLFGVVGSLALIMFIFGGLTWMTSAGNPEKVKKGRDMLIWAAIGMFVVFGSYALVRFLLDSIGAK